MGAYTIFFFSTCRTTIFPFSTLTDTSDTPRLLKLCSMAVFSFSVISTFKDSPPYLVPPRPHADGGGVYRLFTGILRFSQAVRRPVVGLTKALRPRLHRRCFVLPRRLLLFTASFVAGHSDHAFLPGTMTTGFSASRSRPICGV